MPKWGRWSDESAGHHPGPASSLADEVPKATAGRLPRRSTPLVVRSLCVRRPGVRVRYLDAVRPAPEAPADSGRQQALTPAPAAARNHQPPPDRRVPLSCVAASEQVR